MSSTPAAAPASFRSDATIISLVGFAHGTSHFFHLMLPPLFPWFMPEFGLGYAEVGVLMTVFFVISGIGQAIAGIWVDKFGAHRVLCTGVGLLSLSGVIVGIAPNFLTLMVAATVAGMGNSVFHPADFTLLAKRVSAQRMGHAFSTHGISGNLGWALAPLFMTAIASQAGWRAAGFGAALFGAVSLAFLIWKRDLLKYELAHEAPAKSADAPASVITSNSTWSFLKAPMVWYAFAFFFFATFGFGALQNFGPPLLRELFGLSLAASTSALSVYLVGGSLGLVLGGFLAKPGNQHERYVMFAFGSGVLFALAMAFVPLPAWLVLPIMALMGFGIAIAGPSRDLLVRAATKAKLGEGAYGRVYGMVYSGLDVGLAVAPIAFGMLLDRHLNSMVFIGIAITLACGIVAALALGREAGHKGA
jgi:predicted MFS family arabinose efflux permease